MDSTESGDFAYRTLNERTTTRRTSYAPSMDDSIWQTAWENAQPALDKIRLNLAGSTAALPRIVRVGQLDAELLDQELVMLLKQPLAVALNAAKVQIDAVFICFPSSCAHLTTRLHWLRTSTSK